MANEVQVPRMDWSSSNLSETFKLFEQRLNLYFTLKGCKEEEKVATLLLSVGEEGLRRYNSWNLTSAEQKCSKSLMQKFSEQLEPMENYRICRLKLSKFQQQADESLDTFITRCKHMAKKCEFGKEELNERMIELIIGSTPIAEFQKELLTKPKGLTLEEAVVLGRTHEATAAHLKDLQKMSSSTATQSINSMKAKQPNKSSSAKCRNCGTSHPFGRNNCPARNDVCNACKKMGHWASLCFSAKNKKLRTSKDMQPNKAPGKLKSNKRPVDALQEESSSEDDDIPFDTIKIHEVRESRDEAYVTLRIQLDKPGTPKLKLKVDTGAQANTLPYRTFRNMFPSKTDHRGKPRAECLVPTRGKLTAYNGSAIKCKGTITINCKYNNSDWTKVRFYVVDVPGPAVLGLQTCELLKVVTLHCAISQNQPIRSVKDLIKLYPKQFDVIGNLPTECKLKVDPNVPSRINAPRKTPIALKGKIKAELDKMVEQEVIRRIEEPTDWVSSLTYVTKRDGSIRVCLDPRHLNKALIRPQHHIPTVEELNHRFANAKLFSKLDAKAGYWSIKLDPESQKLTTFQTPFGRYCFQRLPFGLSVSQDIFQVEMDKILEQCDGACGIADDVAIFGATEEEHDRNLLQFMEVAAKHGLALNSAKCEIKQKQITFFGNTYSSDGLKPDPQKVKDLQQMPQPKDKTELQQFLGFITYLSRFIKDFSSKTALLRDLLNKDSEFLWEPHHMKAFTDLKEEVSESSLLQYYDTKKPVHLQCDASMRGLGASLLQPDSTGQLQPVAYASKSLSITEQRYACIERELLAIVFGVKRFHTYLYGRSFHVITDHRPLVMIMDKPLTSAPPRLQRLLIELQGYNFTITYRPGSENQLADGLSRLPSPHNAATIDLDMRVDHVRFSRDRITDIQEKTDQDPVLMVLKETIISGWPKDVKELPEEIRSFWSFRDELSVENGLIMKGQQIVIPKSAQTNILTQLHTAHLGQEKTKLLAREFVYWININKDIDRQIEQCQTCQYYQPSQTAEPLLPHDIPTKPWITVAADLFQFDDCNWLILADMYSKYPVVRKLPHHAPSSTIVRILKQIFGEFGIPEKMISDNGPHFVSEAFRCFTDAWGIEHITTSPRRPQGNGFIERQVRTIKGLLKKAKKSGTDYHLTLLMWRSTPISTKLGCPAELLLGRRIRSTLLGKIPNTIAHKNEVHEELQLRQDKQKEYFDQRARPTERPALHQGQQVYVQNTDTKCWTPAVVQEKLQEPRSYMLRDESGAVLRRNRQHIRAAPAQPENTEQDNAVNSETLEAPKAPDVPDSVEHSNSTERENESHTQKTRFGRHVRKPDRFKPG
jgi:hypothetical protein